MPGAGTWEATILLTECGAVKCVTACFSERGRAARVCIGFQMTLLGIKQVGKWELNNY